MQVTVSHVVPVSYNAIVLIRNNGTRARIWDPLQSKGLRESQVLRDKGLQRAAAEVIKEEREKQGLSRRALSVKLKQYDNFIRDVEGQNRYLRFDEFVLIAMALGKAPSRLLVKVTRRAKDKG